MQTLVLLPQLELTMENVRVVALQVKVGDNVVAEQPLIEVETEKAVSPVPAPKPGFVRKIFVNAEDQLRANAPVCILTDTADELFEDSTGQSAAGSESKKAESTQPSAPDAADTPGIKAAPAARKLAKELGVELGAIIGSGPGGRITVEDVQRTNAAASAKTAPGWKTLSAPRLALIAQMQKSLAEIPQFHVARHLDVARLLAKTEQITFTVRLVRCVALALEKHPRLRTVLAGDKIRVEPVSVAIAMETPRGLVAPALRAARLTNQEAIAADLKSLRTMAEAGTLRREELVDAPFAISNLGMFQVDFFSAFVFHGQTAVLAVGRAADGKAWFNLAADHRVVDGAEAARFLETLQQEISRA